MNFLHVLFVALSILLCSCDGHVRSFFPSRAAARSGNLPPGEKQKLVVAIKEVAAERGFTRRDSQVESDSYTVTARFDKQLEHGAVSMELLQDSKTGKYGFVIIDWPSFTRSAESVAVEAAIRKKLEGQ